MRDQLEEEGGVDRCKSKTKVTTFLIWLLYFSVALCTRLTRLNSSISLDGLDWMFCCCAWAKSVFAHAAVQPTNLSPSNERRHRFLARLASYVMGTCGGGCGVVPLSIAFSLHVHVHVYKINSAALALVERISINNINHLFHQ